MRKPATIVFCEPLLTVFFLVRERQAKYSGKPGRAGGFSRPKNIRIAAEVHSNPKEVYTFNLTYSLTHPSHFRFVVPIFLVSNTLAWRVARSFARGQSGTSLLYESKVGGRSRRQKRHLEWSASIVCAFAPCIPV